jgi:hypothetical protein
LSRQFPALRLVTFITAGKSAGKSGRNQRLPQEFQEKTRILLMDCTRRGCKHFLYNNTMDSRQKYSAREAPATFFLKEDGSGGADPTSGHSDKGFLSLKS